MVVKMRKAVPLIIIVLILSILLVSGCSEIKNGIDAFCNYQTNNSIIKYICK